MAKDMVMANSKLPAHLQGAVNAIDEFTGGVQSGFPIISIRGRVWRVKVGGEEQTYTDENDDAVASVEMVLLRSSSKPSKIFYEKKYEEGDDGKPRCFSADGVRPSAEVDSPINKVCAACPNNQWGSRITESGKKSRACSDVRRMAVVTLSDLMQAIEDPNHTATPMLLRVPPASLNPLKDYAAKILAPKGIQPYMLATRVGFDNTAEYPKLTFKPARFLKEDEYNLVLELRDGDEAMTILQQVAEFDPEGTDAGDGADDTLTDVRVKPAEAKTTPSGSSTKKTSKKASKKRDATAAEAEAAATAATVAAVPDADEDDGMAALFGGGDEDEDSGEGEEAVEDDFDAMLNNILGD